MGSSSRNLDKRRVVNACARCRQHKIKCSGDCPCTACIQRKVKCRFEGEETKVHITKKHLSELKRRNIELEKENRALHQQLASSHINAVAAGATPAPDPVSIRHSPINQTVVHNPLPSPVDVSDVTTGQEDESPAMVNPLSCGPPRYITDTAGRPHYLGHTSNWSLTIRLLHLTHQALYKCPFPSASHHVDTMTYSLNWNGTRSTVIPDLRGLPSHDQALFLVNATKFHTGEIFHLFDEPTFMAQLHAFYEGPSHEEHTRTPWFIHFLVIMALGKAFVGGKGRGTSPPGAEYFMTAFMMLPDYCFMWKDPYVSAEILCSMALYLQSIDWRTSAHNLIGQALRMLQIHGYHTNVGGVTDNKSLLRCQNIWWTVYVLERQICVLLGVPLGISESDITASLPNFPKSIVKTVTVAVHVKLSRAFSQVVNTLYRESGVLNSTFVKTTQEVLQGVANVASELRELFPVPEQGSMNGISRVSGYLNLLYHQCIMLATRPFLFGLVETCVGVETAGKAVPMPIQLLLQICIESARKAVSILSALHDQTLLEWFLPFDLESAVSAGLVITMATLVCPSLIENHAYSLDTLSSLLDHMSDRGNLIAADQKQELSQLRTLCEKLKTSPAMTRYSEFSQTQENTAIPDDVLPSDPCSFENLPTNGYTEPAGSQPNADTQTSWLGDATDRSDWAQDMTPSQLLEVVDMLNGDDLLDWVDFSSSTFDLGREDPFV
ncbi:hypothetical protein BJX62DRAFT_252420 [Aspergillus germanicus]